MKKRILLTIMAFMLATSVYFGLPTHKTSAQCGCSCAMVCGNTCQFSCSGCSLTGWIAVAAECCRGAKEATGDLPACGGDN
jgi:hypothetical protein